MPAVQFWDTSAVIPLLVKEAKSSASLRAIAEGSRFLAWSWMQAESFSALVRIGITPETLRRLRSMWQRFEFLDLLPADYHALEKIFMKHRLRSADAGHLYCLKQAKKLYPEIAFVCFDEELAGAAHAEGIRIHT